AVRLRVQHARQDGSDQRGDLAVPRFVRVQRAGGARDHVADMDEADAARAERQRLAAQALAQRPDPALGPGAEPVTAEALGDAGYHLPVLVLGGRLDARVEGLEHLL